MAAFSRLVPLPLRRLRLQWQWRRSRRRVQTLRLRLGQLRSFFERLHREKVRYVVLRWFEDVPLTAEAEKAFEGDVDLLVEASHLRALVGIAALFPGPIKLDIYSPTGRAATAFEGMPYYPPVLADEILAGRVLYQEVFYVPSPRLHFNALAYHLVYHKGQLSGVPTGTDLATAPNPKRDYAQGIQQLGQAAGVPLAKPYTLLALHEYLKQEQWSMPHDLMVRWPQQHDWIQSLARREEQALAAQAERFPNLIVFLLRADAVDAPVRARAIEILREVFELLLTVDLDPEQIKRVMRSVRGGNWVEHKKTVLIEPRVALVCNDPNPRPIAADDERRRKYPLVSNANVFLKEEVRKRLARLFPARLQRVAIHGSDNAYESQHYLEAIFGEEYQRVCRDLEKAIPGRPSCE